VPEVLADRASARSQPRVSVSWRRVKRDRREEMSGALGAAGGSFGAFT
jgi:hypothetical protein